MFVCIRINDVMKTLAIKIRLHPALSTNAERRMPLAPKTRPWPNKSSDAAKPISMPPISDGPGVNDNQSIFITTHSLTLQK